MLRIEQPHYVHPGDVALSGTLVDPSDEGEDARRHPDYVAQARDWLRQYLTGEFNRLTFEDLVDRRERYQELRAQGMGHDAATAQIPPRYTGHGEPQIRELTEPYVTADGVTHQLPYEAPDGTRYGVGWIGTLEVHEAGDAVTP